MHDEAFVKVIDIAEGIVSDVLRQRRGVFLQVISRSISRGEYKAFVEGEEEMTVKDARTIMLIGVIIRAARYASFFLKDSSMDPLEAKIASGNIAVAQKEMQDWVDETFSDDIFDRWMRGFRSHVLKLMFRDQRQIKRIITDVVRKLLKKEDIDKIWNEYNAKRQALIAAQIIDMFFHS